MRKTKESLAKPSQVARADPSRSSPLAQGISPLESVHTIKMPLGKYRLTYATSRRSIGLAKATFIPLKPSAFRVASGLHMEEPVLNNQEDFLLIDCLQDQAAATLVITAKDELELQETKLSLQRLDPRPVTQASTAVRGTLPGKPVRLLNKADRYLPLKLKTYLESQTVEAPDALSWCINPEQRNSLRGLELYWAENLPITGNDLDIDLRLFFSKTQQTEGVVTASIGHSAKVPRGKTVQGIGLTLVGRKASSFELRWQAVFKEHGYSERLLSGEICRGDDLIACRIALVVKPNASKSKLPSRSKLTPMRQKRPYKTSLE